MSAAADAYFADCGGEILCDENGAPVCDKTGRPIIVGAHPPTLTGLAVWLGFGSRSNLLSYKSCSAAMNMVIAEACSRCEEYAERRLYDREGYYGAKFSLACNFSGWGEEPAAKAEGKGVQIIDDI